MGNGVRKQALPKCLPYCSDRFSYLVYIESYQTRGKNGLYHCLINDYSWCCRQYLLTLFFYGQIFTASTPYYVEGATPATLVSWGQGYAPVLMGKVVDMFYFPLFHGTFPDWFPVWGGESFTFFSPIFNFADSCISVGVFIIILAFRKDFNGWVPATEKKVTDKENIADNQ